MTAKIFTVRLIIVFILALIFGLNRQLSNKPVGFGTYIFVSIGACALAYSAVRLNGTNPLPLLGATVTGIGFLGAGALIRNADRIYGFTTASSIWLFAILGIIIGLGHYLVGGTLYLFVWLVLLIDKFFERRNLGNYEKKIKMVTSELYNKQQLSSLLEGNRYKILSISSNKEESEHTIVFLARGKKDYLNQLAKILTSQQNIKSFSIE